MVTVAAPGGELPIDEYVLETGGAETPLDHFVERLAECGREVLRQPRGLLLLTVHRTKGLEFDHVVVLDGGWNRGGRAEDADAPRRLCYVAMTRSQMRCGTFPWFCSATYRSTFRLPCSQLSDGTGDRAYETCSWASPEPGQSGPVKYPWWDKRHPC